MRCVVIDSNLYIDPNDETWQTWIREDLRRTEQGVSFLRVLEDEHAARRRVGLDAVANARGFRSATGLASGMLHAGSDYSPPRQRVTAGTNTERTSPQRQGE